MLVQEEYTCNNGVVLIHTYSDRNVYIKQIETGVLYGEAYDLPNKYTYEETDDVIDTGNADI